MNIIHEHSSCNCIITLLFTQNTDSVRMALSRIYENREFMEFAEAVNYSICREFQCLHDFSCAMMLC